MDVYDQELCSKSSITADTAFRKDLTLQGCTKVSTRTSTLFARSVNIHPSVCRRGLSHDVSQTQSKHGGATPLSLPATKSAGLRDGLRVCDSGCKQQGVQKLGLSIPRKHSASKTVQRAPHTIVNKAVKHGMSTG